MKTNTVFAHLLHSVLQLDYLCEQLSDFLLVSEQLLVLLSQLVRQRHHLTVGLPELLHAVAHELLLLLLVCHRVFFQLTSLENIKVNALTC